VVSDSQEKAAKSIWQDFEDYLRTQQVSRHFRRMTYNAAMYDGSPDKDNLALLADAIEEVDAQITRYLAELDALYVQIKDFQADVDKLVPQARVERDEFAVFGPEALDRLAALYREDRRAAGWKSQNGIDS